LATPHRDIAQKEQGGGGRTKLREKGEERKKGKKGKREGEGLRGVEERGY